MPGTVLNNQFGDLSIEGALEILNEAEPPVEVVGVTDYANTLSFRLAMDAWEPEPEKPLKLLFPNVELRLSVETKRGSGVNIHLMCDPSEIGALDAFLGRLTYRFKRTVYRATSDDLIALGRAFDENEHLAEDAALRAGANQFKVDFDSLRTEYENDPWASNNCVVGVAAGEGDGISGLRDAGGSFESRRREIEQFAHVMFSGAPKERAFWLGDGPATVEDLDARHGGVKLCVHGSDAHDADQLAAPAEDRRFWLKGDPTFDTLFQAMLEPRERSHIGPAHPDSETPHGRISRIHVKGPGWFVDGSVPINHGLVAIIGARGSGKTALADLIAAAALSTTPYENNQSFIRRAGSLMAGSVAATHWSHGDTTVVDFTAGRPDNEQPITPVRYLSQQFVDQLCADDGVSDRLVHEIERVIFDAWPVEQRQQATSFEELRGIRLASAQSRQRLLLETIEELGEDITTERQLRAALKSREEALKARRLELVGRRDDLKALLGTRNRGHAARLEVVRQALDRRNQEHQVLERQITALEGLERAVADARRSEFPRMTHRLRSEHPSAALDDERWDQFAVDFVGPVLDTIEGALNDARERRALIGGAEGDDAVGPLDALTPEQLGARTIRELNADRRRLEHLAGVDARTAQKVRKMQDDNAKAQSHIARLEAEVDRANEAEGRIANLTERRLESYAEYFDALLEEQGLLNDLYAPLGEVLATYSGSSVTRLGFSVKRRVDVAGWAQRGEDLLDLRREGAFRHHGALERIGRECLLDGWADGDGNTAADAVRDFSATYSADLRQQRNLPASASEEEHREWERSVNQWLYSADHVSLTYSIEYDGVDIERLSPGTRGIVLLLLYLAVDQEETHPLIIDQPEENLDPESVHSELVELFRKASRRRQIIMITHNANLVVNTDVDQVIVAKCGDLHEGALPELTYVTGGLENPVIRTEVCQVLEGGEEAFRQRARRLRVSF